MNDKKTTHTSNESVLNQLLAVKSELLLKIHENRSLETEIKATQSEYSASEQQRECHLRMINDQIKFDQQTAFGN